MNKIEKYRGTPDNPYYESCGGVVSRKTKDNKQRSYSCITFLGEPYKKMRIGKKLPAEKYKKKLVVKCS